MMKMIGIMLGLCFGILLTGCAPLAHNRELEKQSKPFLLGQQYYIDGDYETAAVCFQHQIKADPTSSEAPVLYYWVGACRLKQHRYLEAKEAFQACIARQPAKRVEITAWNGIGDCYRMEARFADAAKVYERVLNTGSQGIERDAVTFNRALCLLRDGQTTTAKQAFADFVRDYPDSQWAQTAREKVAMAGSFCVQVGAFEDRDSAQAIVEKLQKQGYQARIESSNGKFCVRTGNEQSWQDVVHLANRLRMAGFSVYCLP